MRPLLIGLTGGIASGKTLVASFFRKKRVPVIDADEIAREVVRPGKKAYREIVSVFGEGVLKADRTIDRNLLGRIVFFNERRRRILETITHPEIQKEIWKRIKNLKKRGAKLIVLDAALLFESGLYRKVDTAILVTIRPSVQKRRLMKRDRISEVEAMSRILSQMPTAKKTAFADFVIDNSGTRLNTRRQFLKIWSDVSAVRRPLLGRTAAHGADRRAP